MKPSVIHRTLDKGVERGPVLSNFFVDLLADPAKRPENQFFPVWFILLNAFFIWVCSAAPYYVLTQAATSLAEANASLPSGLGLKVLVGSVVVFSVLMCVSILIYRILTHAQQSVSRFAMEVTSDLSVVEMKKAFASVSSRRIHYVATLTLESINGDKAYYMVRMATPGVLGYQAEDIHRDLNEAGISVVEGNWRAAGSERAEPVFVRHAGLAPA